MTSQAVEIPKQSLFKVSEVCEIAQVQPYVLRSWESEFPDLGVTQTVGRPRVYRRADVERVLRIKHLLFVEGLTLGAARRRLDEERGPEALESETPLDAPLVHGVRARLGAMKKGLRSILEILSANGSGEADRQVEGSTVVATKRAASLKPPSRGRQRPRSTAAKRKRRSA